MTAREEAYRLIDALPDKGVTFIVNVIKSMPEEFYIAENAEGLGRNVKSRARLEQIAQLEDNWNGNGAAKFPRRHISKVMDILSAIEYEPEVFPTANDTIQIEYDRADGEHIEIEIPETGTAEYFYVDTNGDEKYGSVKAEPNSINALVRRFYGSGI